MGSCVRVRDCRGKAADLRRRWQIRQRFGGLSAFVDLKKDLVAQSNVVLYRCKLRSD